MGYLAGNRCYETFAAWQDAVYSQIPPVHTPGATSYEINWQYQAGVGWASCRSQISSTGVRSANACTSVAVGVPAVQTCSVATYFLDGASIGFGVAAVLVSVWAWVRLRRELV